MDWSQVLLNTLTTLGWWRIVIIVVAIFLVGILVSTAIVYLILRFVRKDHIRYVELFGLLINKYKPIININNEPFSQKESVDRVEDVLPNKTQLTTAPKIESILISKDLFAELDNNLAIINNFDGKVLLPLRNTAWLAHLSSNDKLITDLEHQLGDVYTDISLWNNMVLITTELIRKDNFVDDLYQKSLLNIAERLQTIRQNIK
jgi:hypothetical protein